MTNSQNHPQTNFWFGFAFGIVATSGIGFFLGTKKGREYLKKFLELADNFDGDMPSFIKKVIEELGPMGEEFKEEAQNFISGLEPKKPEANQVRSIGSILQKIKFLSPHQTDKTHN